MEGPAIQDIAQNTAQMQPTDNTTSCEGKYDYDTNESLESAEDTITKFEDLCLKSELLRGVFGHGFEKPSTIQQKGIKPIINGHDVIGQAQSGTGKTATFVIAALQLIDYKRVTCQVLILAPTRELAQQINSVLYSIGNALKIVSHVCVGGTDVREDLARIEAGVHVVVGTPGRVIDMIYRKALNPSQVKLFILDEADEILTRGFRDQIRDIYKSIPSKPQCVLFSATMPKEVFDITARFMNHPKTILVKKDELTLEGIRQFYVIVEEHDKVRCVESLYQILSISQSIIYVNSRRRADSLVEHMVINDHTVSKIHGEMTQKDRDVIMRQFRSGSTRALVTTDLLSRGIDVQQVSLVINFEIPPFNETYIHRIGRSGRFGKKGLAINLVVPGDEFRINQLETYYNTQIQRLHVPRSTN